LREEVAAKERAHTELGQAQERLITASRQAGMADVATEILHNVGNVLNSVNVSAGLLLTHARQSRLASLPKLVTLLEAQNGRLAEFLTQDPKGQRIPGFLGSLSKVWIEEQTFAIAELRLLSDKIDHIKEIVAMQQNYATVSGVIEALSITGLVDEAIRLNAGALGRQGVRMEPQFEEVPLVVTDKHKVLQILLNLIRNAHQACQEGGKEPKVVISRVFSPNPERVSVQVIDNGIGIRPENLNKIFSHGFTTRKDGHGFGLHSGANAAKSLGGNLTAQSAGPGQGATFTLELPVQGKARSRQPSEA